MNRSSYPLIEQVELVYLGGSYSVLSISESIIALELRKGAEKIANTVAIKSLELPQRGVGEPSTIFSGTKHLRQ